MHITAIRIAGLRAFEDTGLIKLSPGINIFVGQNNAGKSTILKVPMALQGHAFTQQDLRAGSTNQYFQIQIQDVPDAVHMRIRPSPGPNYDIVRQYRAPALSPPPGYSTLNVTDDQAVFTNGRPQHAFEIYLARRKAQGFNQAVDANSTNTVSGNLNNLFARINHLDASGHPNHAEYIKAVKDIVGVPITMRAAQNGQEAGFYMDPDNFVSLERMGDGVSEMMALIVELALAKNKIFVMEEPETNLHPKGLKALMGMVREASERNQFLIATHSNIVVRELGSEPTTKVFQVFREGDDYKKPSLVREVAQEPIAHTTIMRDLGYEFGDMQLHDGWLFLEEASAESIVEQVLIPLFAPQLRGKIRTFSAGGATNLSACISAFQRLITYVHLQPAYTGRLWVRADGDDTGKQVIASLKITFPYLDDEHCSAFGKEQFELYYPTPFLDRAKTVVAISDKQQRRDEKLALLNEVLIWSAGQTEVEVRTAWQASAAEVIAFLGGIAAAV